MPRFPDVSDGLGIDSNDLAGGAIVDDFDNDGYYDVMISAWVMVLFAVAVSILLTRTPFGRWLYATGSNERAAQLSGVRERRAAVVAGGILLRQAVVPLGVDVVVNLREKLRTVAGQEVHAADGALLQALLGI